MKILVTGGTGFIGQALIKKWLQAGYDITVLGRSEQKIKRIYGAQVTSWTWQTLAERTADFDVVVHLAGYNIAARYWTKTVQKNILASRLETTQQLVAWCAGQSNPPRLLSASAVGIYGCHQDTTLSFDEESKILMQPECFSQQVVCAWEEAVQTYQASSVCMRLGVVMGHQGGMFRKMIWPFRFGLGAVIGSGQQPLAWVAIEDVVSAISFLLPRDDLTGAINITGPKTLSQSTFAKALSTTLRRPLWLKIPAALLRLMMGQMADELILAGQVVVPQKLMAHGYVFQFDDFHQWLK